MKILNSDELNLKMESMGGEKVKQAIELFTEMKDSKEFNKINIYKDFLEEKALELNVDINKKGMKDRIFDSLLMQDIMFFLEPKDGINLFSLKTFDYLYDKTNVWEQAIERFGLDPNTIDPSTLPNLGLPIEEDFDQFDLNNYKNMDMSDLNIGDLIVDNYLKYINNLEMDLYRKNSYLFEKCKEPDNFYEFGEWLYKSLDPYENDEIVDFLTNDFFDNESIQEEFFNVLQNIPESKLKKDFNKESINIIKNSKNYNEIHEQIHDISENDYELTKLTDKFLFERLALKAEEYENNTLENNDDNKKYIKIFDNAKMFYDNYLEIKELTYDKYISLVMHLDEEKLENLFEDVEYGHKILIESYLEKYGNVEFPIDLDKKFKIKDENIPLIAEMIKEHYESNTIFETRKTTENKLNFLIDNNYKTEAKDYFDKLKDDHKSKLSEKFLDKINNLDSKDIDIEMV